MCLETLREQEHLDWLGQLSAEIDTSAQISLLFVEEEAEGQSEQQGLNRLKAEEVPHQSSAFWFSSTSAA